MKIGLMRVLCLLAVAVLLSQSLVSASTLSGNVGNGVVHLTWTPTAEAGLEGYNVYYGAQSGIYDGSTASQGSSPVWVPLAGIRHSDQPDFSLTALPSGVEHFFQVMAVVSAAETDPSNEIALTPTGWAVPLTPTSPFQNPGFESDFAVWNCQWSPTSYNITSSIDSNIKLFGAKSLNIVSLHNYQPYQYYISSSQDAPTTANTDYVISFWIRAENAKAGAFLSICNMDGGWDQRFGIPAGTYPWTRVSYIHSTGPSNQFLYAFDCEDYGTVWVDGIEMVPLGDVQLGSPYTETFSRYEGNPVLEVGPSGSLDDAHVYSPVVFKESDTSYRMYYVMHDGTNTRIGMATSDDGYAWTKYAGNPVLDLGSDGSWEDAHVQPSCVLKIGALYHLYYYGHDGTHYRIGHATSDDGISWTRDPANPVLSIGNEGSFTSHYVYAPWVLYDEDQFKMWYTAYDSDSRLYYIGYATSPDGSAFTRQGIVMSPDTLGEMDRSGVLNPIVLKTSEPGYEMWYTGNSPNGNVGCYATSAEGTSWISQGSVLSPSWSDTYDCRNAAPKSVIAEGGGYRMWYYGYDLDKVWSINVAELGYSQGPTPTPTATVTPTPTGTPATSPTPHPADINEDGRVDCDDAFLLHEAWHWEAD